MSKKSSTFALAFVRKCGRPNSQSEFIATSKFRRDSVAQQVEHIPFKDGVQGSSPC